MSRSQLTRIFGVVVEIFLFQQPCFVANQTVGIDEMGIELNL